MWGIVDPTDDLVLFGAVGRKEAEDLAEMCQYPGELEAARRNALSHAHEHTEDGIVYDERRAAHLPAASDLRVLEREPIPGRPAPPKDGMVV